MLQSLSCKFCLFIFLLLGTLKTSAQDSVSHYKKLKILPVPAFGYAPETKGYIGAVTLFTLALYDTTTRTSNAKIEFNYTWNKQLIIENEWNYFFNHERWFTKGRLHYSKYPDFYYGVGSFTQDSDKIVFNSDRIIAEAYGLKHIGRKIFTGLNLRYIKYSEVHSNTSKEDLRLIDSRTIGLGYSVLVDRRNSILTPSSGTYAFMNVSYNMQHSDYWKIIADLRAYRSWKSRYTLALRLYNEFNTGTPAFYDLAFLGGDKFVRGYYFGRYRDNHLSTLQAEFRSALVWRLGLAAFSGLGSIYPNLNAFHLSTVKYNYGLGVRFMVDKREKTNLRLDYAIGENGNNGFYVAFGESF